MRTHCAGKHSTPHITLWGLLHRGLLRWRRTLGFDTAPLHWAWPTTGDPASCTNASCLLQPIRRRIVLTVRPGTSHACAYCADSCCVGLQTQWAHYKLVHSTSGQIPRRILLAYDYAGVLHTPVDSVLGCTMAFNCADTYYNAHQTYHTRCMQRARQARILLVSCPSRAHFALRSRISRTLWTNCANPILNWCMYFAPILTMLGGMSKERMQVPVERILNWFKGSTFFHTEWKISTTDADISYCRLCSPQSIFLSAFCWYGLYKRVVTGHFGRGSCQEKLD